jgi:hypothetical protein
LRDGSALAGLDAAGTLAALDGVRADLIAEEFLQRACACQYEPALDVEIEYQLQRVGSEVGDGVIEEVALESGLA